MATRPGTESNAPHRSLCAEARSLLERYEEAVVQVITAQEIHFQAVVAADENSSRFDAVIEQAMERRDNAKYAYLSHVQEHGCSYLSPRDPDHAEVQRFRAAR